MWGRPSVWCSTHSCRIWHRSFPVSGIIKSKYSSRSVPHGLSQRALAWGLHSQLLRTLRGQSRGSCAVAYRHILCGSSPVPVHSDAGNRSAGSHVPRARGASAPSVRRRQRARSVRCIAGARSDRGCHAAGCDDWAVMATLRGLLLSCSRGGRFEGHTRRPTFRILVPR
jgi:hypothetical protein